MRTVLTAELKRTITLLDNMHCKDVSVHDVDILLTTENINKMMQDWTTYVRTEYIVFRNEDQYAVIGLEKESGSELFRKLISFYILALPEDIVFINNPNLDVLNTPALAYIQNEYPGKTIVVQGMFSHVNFIKDMKPVKLRVIDNVPPAPSKLGVLVNMALNSGFVEHPVVIDSIEVDMAERIWDVNTPAIMFPCEVSGLTAKKIVYFLDKAPKLEHDVTLVGCHLSERVFFSLYKKEVPFINVCPMDHVIYDGVKTIVKCCKVKSGFIIEGDVATVPWGATVPEVVSAINALFKGSK